MDEDNLTKELLCRSVEYRPHTLRLLLAVFKLQYVQHHRSASVLFFGAFSGFVLPFLLINSGYVGEMNAGLDYSLRNETSEIAENPNLAVFLQNKIRVMCIVMTDEKGIHFTARIIMETWGKRCTKTLFFSQTVKDRNLTNVVLNNETDSFAKLREAYGYVNMHYPNEFDWIMKTTDNSFIILENLRHFLYQFDSDWPLIIGQRTLKERSRFFKDFMLGVFVLSKRAFTRLLEDAFPNTEICPAKGNPTTWDDKEVMKCLEHINVIKVDGIDRQGRGMFFRNSPESQLITEKVDQLDRFYLHKFKQGVESCCSDRLISIQNVFVTHLYYMEYYIYKVHAFGRHRDPQPLPEKFTLEEVIKENL